MYTPESRSSNRLVNVSLSIRILRFLATAIAHVRTAPLDSSHPLGCTLLPLPSLNIVLLWYNLLLFLQEESFI